MKIAIITDTHGIARPLLEQYQDKLVNIDIVFLLGDYYSAEIQLINSIFQVLLLGIHGNHDDINVFNNSNVINIHNTQVKLSNNITISGFQGSSKYKPTQYYGYTQKEAQQEIKDLPKSDIFISHDGPMGYCGDIRDNVHCGLKAITDYIKKNQPKLVFFGHHHKNMHFQIGNTDCYCVYELGIFDIDNQLNVTSYETYYI